MTLGDIIKRYRTEHDLSMDAFAAKSGMSKAYISLLEKNQHPKTGKPIAPSLRSIKQAADGMNMDFDVLIKMIDGNVRLNYRQDTSIISPDLQPLDIKSYPALGSVACGEPILMTEEKSVYVSSTTDIRADFILIAKGDSMTGARIYDGDIVFIRQQPEVENGEIAAVAIDDETTLKRFYKYGELIVLRAENPEYKDMEFKPEDGKSIRIIGKAIAFQSDIR